MALSGKRVDSRPELAFMPDVRQASQRATISGLAVLAAAAAGLAAFVMLRRPSR